MGWVARLIAMLLIKGTTVSLSFVKLRVLTLLLIWQVIAVGPGPLDDQGNRKPLSIAPGNNVLYSKYAGNDFKGKDGSEYITLRGSDIIAVLS